MGRVRSDCGGAAGAAHRSGVGLQAVPDVARPPAVPPVGTDGGTATVVGSTSAPRITSTPSRRKTARSARGAPPPPPARIDPVDQIPTPVTHASLALLAMWPFAPPGISRKNGSTYRLRTRIDCIMRTVRQGCGCRRARCLSSCPNARPGARLGSSTCTTRTGSASKSTVKTGAHAVAPSGRRARTNEATCTT